MSTVSRFIKNTAILMVAKALQPFITFYLIITISRLIGVEGFGAYSTIFKYVPVFSIVAGFGLRNLLARDISQDRDRAGQYLMTASVLAISCAVISAIVMSLIVNLLSDNELVIMGAMIASISLLAVGLSDVYEGIISGFEQIKHVGYALFLENLFRVGISLFLIYQGFGILAVVFVFVIGRFLRTTYLLLYIKKKLNTSFGRFDRPFFGHLFKQARTFALIMICVTIYWNVDGIMLESMRSAEEVGYYSAAYRFFALSMILVHSYVTSLYPVISNYFKNAKNNFEIACRKSLRFLLLATFPIAIAFTFFAKDIIFLLFSETYTQSVLVLQILIWGLIPYAISQIFAYALVASEKQNIDLKVNTIAMLTNVVLNFILIPRFGFIGATAATLVSIHIYVGAQIPFVIQKLIRFDFKSTLSYGIRMVMAVGLMISTIIMLKDFSFFVILPLSGIIYLISLFVLRLITRDDRQMVFKYVGQTV